jgi:hypothetical protein
MARLLKPVRALLFPPANVALSYSGVTRNLYTGHPITGGLTNLSVEGSFDGGALTSVGLTVDETDLLGNWDLTATALVMAATYGTIYVTCDNADSETFTIDFRTDGRRELAYGIPRDERDAALADYCQMTGILCPQSALKMVDGLMVGEFWETGTKE